MSYALITGASKGIGKAIALELAAKKYNVLLVARSKSELEDLSIEIEDLFAVKAHYLAIDLAIEKSAETVFNWVKENNFNVSILINNAGYGLSGYFNKYDIKEVLNMMQLNMQALVQLTYYFIPELQNNKQGYILNIASIAAYQAVPGLSVYAATKSFVLSFSRGLYQEFKGTTISVTCISPGPTETDFVKRANLGPQGLKNTNLINLKADHVAKIGIKAMFNKKPEVVCGVINKLATFLTWLLPKNIVERIAMNFYK